METKVKSPESAPKKSKLNPKQILFVKEYLKDLNAKQATIRAGYPAKGAGLQAHRLISNENIQEALSLEFQERTHKVEVSVEFVLRELMNMANCDVGEAFLPDGSLKGIHDIPTPVRKSIASFEVEEIWEFTREGRKRVREQIGELKKVKFWDKKGSVELLGKYLAMFVERQRQEGPDGQPLPAVQVHVHKHIAAPVTESNRLVVTGVTPELVPA